MKWIKSALLWPVLVAVAMTVSYFDGAKGDAGVALGMIYGAFASYATVGYWFFLAIKERRS